MVQKRNAVCDMGTSLAGQGGGETQSKHCSSHGLCKAPCRRAVPDRGGCGADKLASSVFCTPQTRHRSHCTHWPGQEQAPGLCSQREGWTSDQCRVMGYRTCSLSYSPCARRRYTPCWSGCLWQHVPWWPHVRSHKDMAQVAPEDQH